MFKKISIKTICIFYSNCLQVEFYQVVTCTALYIVKHNYYYYSFTLTYLKNFRVVNAFIKNKCYENVYLSN
jgi:hypothetical protein